MNSRIELIKHLRAAATDMKMGIHSPSHIAAMEKTAEVLESRMVKVDERVERVFRYYCCPRCDAIVSRDYKNPAYPHRIPMYEPAFCPDCGQALSWPVKYVEPAKHE